MNEPYSDFSSFGLYRYFSSREEEATADYEQARWRESLPCPSCPYSDCGSSETAPYLDKSKDKSKPYRCRSCDRFFSVRTGTPYDDGRPLWWWSVIDSFKYSCWLEGLTYEQWATGIFERYQWGGFPQCPYCGSENVEVVKNGEPMAYRCRKCRNPRKHFSVRMAVLIDSHVSLYEWLFAIFYYYGSGGKITAAELASAITAADKKPVAKKTAQNLLNKLAKDLQKARAGC